ncbi:MAG: PIN domain nuclease [Candidatus Dormibacteria bacterium]
MAGYLADKSAMARVHLPPVASRMEALFLAGEIAACGMVDLELLVSARTAAHYLGVLADRRWLSRAEVGEAAIDRAVEVQTALARAGRHRGVAIPDLLIAATAEGAGLTVLRFDADFDLMAEITGRPTEWGVQMGSASQPARFDQMNRVDRLSQRTLQVGSGHPHPGRR